MSNSHTARFAMTGRLPWFFPSALSAVAPWGAIRGRWREQYKDIIIVTVAGVGNYESSFSADTGMAECLIIGTRTRRNKDTGNFDTPKRASFVVLNQQVRSAAEGELLAKEVRRLIEAAKSKGLRTTRPSQHLRLGEDVLGVVVDAPIPETGAWPLAGISDGDPGKNGLSP